MVSIKFLFFVALAIACVVAEEAVREKKQVFGVGYPYGAVGYTGLGYTGLGYTGLGYNGLAYTAGIHPYAGHLGAVVV